MCVCVCVRTTDSDAIVWIFFLLLRTDVNLGKYMHLTGGKYILYIKEINANI